MYLYRGIMCIESCRTEFLQDIPNNRDEFYEDTISEIGYSRVAQSIAQIIKESKTGKIISIEGQWGSGKSTIVKMVHRRLSTKQKFEFVNICFDAWSYINDSIRRVFLISVFNQLPTPIVDEINSAVSKGSKKDQSVDNVLDTLYGKKTEAVTRIKYNSRYNQILIALIFIALTLGVAFLRTGIDRLVYYPTSEKLVPNHNLIIGLVISLFPLIFFGLSLWAKKRKLKRINDWLEISNNDNRINQPIY